MVSDFDTLDAGLGGGMALSAEDQAKLRTAAKWSRFLSIVFFIFIGLAVISIVIGGSALFASELSGLGGLGSLLMLFYFIAFAIAGYMGYCMWQFGSNMLRALDSGSHTAAAAAWTGLKNYFLVAGIITAVYLAITAFILLFGLIASL